jgi:hypothetical protein
MIVDEIFAVAALRESWAEFRDQQQTIVAPMTASAVGKPLCWICFPHMMFPRGTFSL